MMPTVEFGRWSRAGARARRYVERNMVSTVAVGRPGRPEAHSWESARATVLEVVYDGRAHVGVVGSGGQQSPGERLAYMSAASFTLPLRDQTAKHVQVDDIVEVTSHFDADLVGRFFRVVNVDAGGQLPVGRRLAVTSVQRSPQWTWSYDVYAPTRVLLVPVVVP